ncbi:MAG: YihY/virulence factor BrkB family protein [Alphaproteobacteria bacterium]|nr:YihY/virulence factor BrkB family protein [Alphaproteobacteria bacterium]
MEGLDAFMEDEALTRGAAIAFYIVTAIAPTLFIALMIASFGFGEDAAMNAIRYQLGRFMSHDSVQLLQTAIAHPTGSSTGIISTLIGVVTLILTASGVFGEMEDALNIIWRAPRKGSVLRRLLHGRAKSLILVIALGFMLLLSMGFTAGITFLGRYIDDYTPYSKTALWVVNFAASIFLMSLLFSAIYKVLPNRNLEWRDVAIGAVITALLFQLGQFLIGTYIGSTGLGASYGAAGGLIVMLAWVYYSAQVFLLGAEFTKVYACQFGSQKSGICNAPPGDQT